MSKPNYEPINEAEAPQLDRRETFFSKRRAQHSSEAPAAATQPTLQPPVDPHQKDTEHPPPRQKYAYFLIVVTVVQIAGLIWSLIYNNQITGSVIQTSPFNYLIGPSAQTLIFMGARFVPCMRQNVTLAGQNIPFGNTPFLCPPYVFPGNTSAVKGQCTMNDVCGLGGFSDPAVPDQWYRLLIPIFLHGGVVHLLFNMMFQVRTGFEMEKDIGWWRTALIYFISGLAGFLFGASFAQSVSGVGASGAIFGLIAALLLDLFYNWGLIHRPGVELVKMIFVILLTFFIGTLPSIDNFAHVGGFIAGLLASLILLPPGHLQGHRIGKWVQLVFRIAAVPALAVLFWYFATYFYSNKTDCQFCHYINCFPPLPWCDAKFQSL